MAVEIVCHRGANAQAPENTYAAAQTCLDWGVDYVEIDVRTSKDGVMYLLHDATVDRTTNGSGAIAELNAAEIDKLDAGSWFSAEFSGQRIPRLEPFLQWLNARLGVFFDVKDANLNVLVPLVRKYGLAERSFFWFEQDSDALALRKMAPDFTLKMNARTVADVIRADEIFGATIIEVGLADLSQPIIQACRERNLRLMVYERGADPVVLGRALMSGVDMLNTNHGDVVLALHARAGERGSAFTAVATDGAGPKGHPPPVRYVLLVMFDGCRPDALTQADAPNLHKLMEEGAYTLNGKTVMPSITLPCHTSLFYSMSPEVHGVLSNDWTPLPDDALSMVEVFSDYGYSTAAFYTWDQLRDLAPAGTFDLIYYRRLSEEAFEDVVSKANQLIATHAPNFAFVYLEGVDALGHRHGWMSPEYYAAVRRQDEIVGELLARYRELDIERETLVVVMADHGGHEHGHGTELPEDMTIPVIMCGPTVRRGHEITQPVSILDVAPTIMSHVGLPIPDSWMGKNIVGVTAPAELN